MLATGIAPFPAIPVSWRAGDSECFTEHANSMAAFTSARGDLLSPPGACDRAKAPVRSFGLLSGRGLLTVSDVFFGVVDRSVEGIHDAHGKVVRVAIVLRPRHAAGRAARFDPV